MQVFLISISKTSCFGWVSLVACDQLEGIFLHGGGLEIPRNSAPKCLNNSWATDVVDCLYLQKNGATNENYGGIFQPEKTPMG